MHIFFIKYVQNPHKINAHLYVLGCRKAHCDTSHLRRRFFASAQDYVVGDGVLDVPLKQQTL